MKKACASRKPAVVFIVGPTAAGKTAASIALAKKINGEIISCDSMQVYRGMDIITSKPSPAQLREVRHHLIGCIALAREFNVSLYRRLAVAAMRDILKRGKVPIFVGGTGMYMTILLDGIFNAPRVDVKVRRRLALYALRHGSPKLHVGLKTVDPVSAGKIHPNDTKRILRALEVYESTGKPISSLQPQRAGIAGLFDTRIVCLDMDRQRLYARIGSRIDAMFAGGLVKEVKQLLARKLSLTARYAIGLGELNEYFAGRLTLEEAKELMKKNTRHYAKRQLTWFRKDKRIEWIEIGEKSAKQAAQLIEKILRGA